MNIRKHGSDACQALGDPSFLEQGKLRWMVSLKLPKKDLLRNNFKSEPVNNQNYYFLLQFLNTFFQNHKIIVFLRYEGITNKSSYW